MTSRFLIHIGLVIAASAVAALTATHRREADDKVIDPAIPSYRQPKYETDLGSRVTTKKGDTPTVDYDGKKCVMVEFDTPPIRPTLLLVDGHRVALDMANFDNIPDDATHYRDNKIPLWSGAFKDGNYTLYVSDTGSVVQSERITIRGGYPTQPIKIHLAYGDVTGDNRITPLDVDIIRHYSVDPFAGGEIADRYPFADMFSDLNDDHKIDVKDILIATANLGRRGSPIPKSFIVKE